MANPKKAGKKRVKAKEPLKIATQLERPIVIVFESKEAAFLELLTLSTSNDKSVSAWAFPYKEGSIIACRTRKIQKRLKRLSQSEFNPEVEQFPRKYYYLISKIVVARLVGHLIGFKMKPVLK